MPNWVRTCISAFFYYAGLVKLARWWRLRSGQYLIILNYHRAAGGDLCRHLLYLRRHYRILHLEAALEELYSPSNKRGLQKADRRPLMALTFDDGYHDNYTDAAVVARQLQVPITIFLIPGYIESGNCFWWLEGDHLIRHAQVDEVMIEGRTYSLKQEKEQKALAQAIYVHARCATSVAEREMFLTSTRKALTTTSSVTAEEKLALPLTWTEIREMQKSEWISFGAHTMNHPILAYLADPNEVQFEVEQCRATLEKQLEHAVHIFAYPVGQLEHIGDTALHAVQQVGYSWAVTTIDGFNTPQTDPYLLRRRWADVSQHWLDMAVQVSGVWSFFSRLSRMPMAFIRILARLDNWRRRHEIANE